MALRQRGLVAVEMPPLRLHDADLLVGEVMHGALEEVRCGNEVGVEDSHQLASRRLEPGSQRAALESLARISVMADDIDALGSESLAALAHDLGAIVG